MLGSHLSDMSRISTYEFAAHGCHTPLGTNVHPRDIAWLS